MEEKTLLQVNDLSIQFNTIKGRVAAVNGISFNLKKGETLGIVGESGSGKTITSLALMGLLPKQAEISSGNICFKNKREQVLNLEELEQKEFQAIRGSEVAMIFQEPMTSLNPVFRCGNQVVEAILLHQKLNKKEAKEKAISLFKKVKLKDPQRIFDSYPHQLSGGQRQRVMIAIALSCNPSILIADEPTSALDVTVQRSILDLINVLKLDLEGAIIFISHDLSVVAEVVDRLLVMKDGKIVEAGMVEDVFKKPKHEYTKKLLKDFRGDERGRTNKKKSETPVFTIKNLSTWFPSKKNFFGKTISHTKAVDDVSFDIYEGETLGLVGESGSGKTTLGRTLLYLQTPNGGSVIYNGNALEKVPDKHWKNLRQEVQIIFQDPFSALNPRQMIGPALMEPMQEHAIGKDQKERRQLALELLFKVGLMEEHFWRFPKEFSGGQRQRICIARALAVRPRFLICDECVSALDVTVQAKILKLLEQLQEENNLTYLFISHDLSVVRQISDRIAVMQNGRIVELGDADVVFDHPKEGYTKELLESIPGKDRGL